MEKYALGFILGVSVCYLLGSQKPSDIPPANPRPSEKLGEKVNPQQQTNTRYTFLCKGM
jgi:hypothetical protein